MATAGAQLDSEKFSCSICLDLLKDPVTVPCGHSYCSNCINGHWDGEKNRGSYSCPQCRKRFKRRPNLKKNIMLAELVEDLKKTRLQAAAADLCSAGPEDVSCDVCPGRKLKAIKSCRVCLASYCEEHLQPHYQAAPLKKHQLVEPSRNLQDNICSRHDEVMKIFCRTDQQCICYLCTMDQHRGHETVPAAAERMEKQKEVEASRLNIQQRIQQREKEVELLQQQVEAINASADEAVEHSEESFTQMIRLIQKRSGEVKQQLRSQQQTAVSGVKELKEKLQQETVQLKRKDVQLEQLSHTEDHQQFLHSYPSVSALSEPTHSSSIHPAPLTYFKDVATAVTEIRETIQDILRETGTDVSPRDTGEEEEEEEEDEEEEEEDEEEEDEKEEEEEDEEEEEEDEEEEEEEDEEEEEEDEEEEYEEELLLPQAQPETREDFLQYSLQIHLDPNTASRKLVLTDRNRKVTLTSVERSYSDHPDRFTTCPQVLSRESLTGRHYWEVERTGRGIIAVTYKNISRSGSNRECGFGLNDKSWALLSGLDRFTFHHNSTLTPVPGRMSSRVGVYLDHTAGILSFYSVSGTMTLLHRVQTSFTQPLHAGVLVLGSAEFIKPQ